MLKAIANIANIDVRRFLLYVLLLSIVGLQSYILSLTKDTAAGYRLALHAKERLESRAVVARSVALKKAKTPTQMNLLYILPVWRLADTCGDIFGASWRRREAERRPIDKIKESERHHSRKFSHLARIASRVFYRFVISAIIYIYIRVYSTYTYISSVF